MDMQEDEPKIGVNVHRRTTQLNLWMIVAIVVFFLAGALIVIRFLRDPPDSHEEMKTGGRPSQERLAWVKRLC